MRAQIASKLLWTPSAAVGKFDKTQHFYFKFYQTISHFSEKKKIWWHPWNNIFKKEMTVACPTNKVMSRQKASLILQHGQLGRYRVIIEVLRRAALRSIYFTCPRRFYSAEMGDGMFGKLAHTTCQDSPTQLDILFPNPQSIYTPTM